MGWGGIDAIPVREGERRRDAVERVYEGSMRIFRDGENMMIEETPSSSADATRVSRSQHHWMVEAAAIMEDLWPGWEIQDETKALGRRWPRAQTLVHPAAPMWANLHRDVITFKNIAGYGPVDDSEWRFWWRTVRRFAAMDCVIFEPDEDEIVATSLSAAAARERYNWL